MLNTKCIFDTDKINKIFGMSNVLGATCINSNAYTIELGVLKYYGNKLDESIYSLMTEKRIYKLELHKKLIGQIDNLPNTITDLVLYKSDDSQINDLPNSIERIYFLNHSGELNNLCPQVKLICLDGKFNYPVNNLPIQLEELMFGSAFNQPVDNLPTGLKIIKFGSAFNQSINDLPTQLERIIFGSDFNQPIDNLPNTVVYIGFDWAGTFSQPIYRFPNKLEELVLPNSFSNSICDLPPGLKKLTLGTKFSVPFVCPENLEKIKLSSKYKYMGLIKRNVIKETYF